MDLQHSRQHVLQYWARTPLQLQQANRLYQHMRVGAAQRQFSRHQGADFLSPGCRLVTHQDWTRRFSSTILHPLLVQGPPSSLVARQDLRPHHNGRPLHRPFLGRPRTSQAQALLSRYTTAIGAERDSWCLQTRQGRTFSREFCATSTSPVESNLPTPP